jgi:hypothetical protein
MAVIGYEKHIPAAAGERSYIIERYDNGVGQVVDNGQDAYLAWQALGNQPAIINDAPKPEVPVLPPGDAALVAVQDATHTLAEYVRANPEQALAVVEGLESAVGGGGDAPEA